MSYCRLPDYIYPTEYGINFLSSNAEVSNDEIDIFLYKIFLTRRNEFIKRIKHGKEIVMKWQDNEVNDHNYNELIKFHKEMGSYSDDEIEKKLEFCRPNEKTKNEAKEYKQWLLDKEDNLFKKLINDKIKKE